MKGQEVLATFFSTHGRSPVIRAVLVVVVAVAIAWGGIVLMRDGSVAVVTLVGAVFGATAAKLAVELVRRRHDRGTRGRAIAVGLLIFALAFVAYVMFVLPQPAFYVVAAVAAVGLAWILFAPGDRGDNAYGSPAKTPFESSGTRGTRTAAGVGIALTLGGALVAFGGATWLQATARRQAENQRWAEQHASALDQSQEAEPDGQAGNRAASEPNP